MEFHLDSPYDWVEVHDGSEEQDQLLGHFSGSELPQVIVSTGPAIFVRFKTDLSHGERGFNATYETGRGEIERESVCVFTKSFLCSSLFITFDDETTQFLFTHKKEQSVKFYFLKTVCKCS